MIRRGKAEEWLQLPVNAVKTWAENSGVEFTNVTPTIIPHRGLGLVASRNLKQDTSAPVRALSVTGNLVLSRDTIFEYARSDQDFGLALESLGDFGKTARGSILFFLLFQASLSCPDLSEPIGLPGAFTDYVKTLPCESLPIFWSLEELHLLVGTTLAPAVSSKLKSLRREFDLLCKSTAETRWFQIVGPHLDFDDWMQVDAMFRSRALDFCGSCMIPGMDIASHAANEKTNAYYDRFGDSYTLWLIDGKEVKEGEEITITYGDEKGACEMLFSYGFIEDCMETAETLFLSLTIPGGDLNRDAKMRIAGCAPGVKLVETYNHNDDNAETRRPRGYDGQIEWDGNFIWLLCVGEEDGLQFEAVRTIDAQNEDLQATFQGEELKSGAAGLRELLAASALWDVYKLRAVVMLQQRVFDQLQVLYETQDEVEAVSRGDEAAVKEQPYQFAMKLRRLEFELLERAYEDLEAQKLDLAESPTVRNYLTSMQQDPDNCQ